MRLIFGFEMRWYMRILNSVLETASKYPQLAICLLVQKLTKLDYHRHPQTDASQSSLDSAQFSIVFLLDFKLLNPMFAKTLQPERNKEERA